MKNRLFILLAGLVISTNLFGHKYYVSITNMEYKEADNKIDVSLKMTAHDFEHLLELKFNTMVNIEEVADSSEIGLFVVNYIKENFTVSSAGVLANFSYHGKEVTIRDDLYFYMSFSNIISPKTIQIKNKLLFSLFAQQQNIVHYKYGEQTKSLTLVPAQSEGEIKID